MDLPPGGDRHGDVNAIVAKASSVGSPTSTCGPARCCQVLLTSLGNPAPPTGAYDAATRAALLAFQHAAHLAETGAIDSATRTVMLTPSPPPVHPMN